MALKIINAHLLPAGRFLVIILAIIGMKIPICAAEEPAEAPPAGPQGLVTLWIEHGNSNARADLREYGEDALELVGQYITDENVEHAQRSLEFIMEFEREKYLHYIILGLGSKSPEISNSCIEEIKKQVDDSIIEMIKRYIEEDIELPAESSRDIFLALAKILDSFQGEKIRDLWFLLLKSGHKEVVELARVRFWGWSLQQAMRTIKKHLRGLPDGNVGIYARNLVGKEELYERKLIDLAKLAHANSDFELLAILAKALGQLSVPASKQVEDFYKNFLQAPANRRLPAEVKISAFNAFGRISSKDDAQLLGEFLQSETDPEVIKAGKATMRRLLKHELPKTRRTARAPASVKRVGINRKPDNFTTSGIQVEEDQPGRASRKSRKRTDIFFAILIVSIILAVVGIAMRLLAHFIDLRIKRVTVKSAVGPLLPGGAGRTMKGAEDGDSDIEALNKQIESAIAERERIQNDVTEKLQILTARIADKINKQDYAGVIQDYLMAIQMDPQNAEHYFGRGFTRLQLADYKGAIEDNSMAINLNRYNGQAYYNRALAKRELGDMDGSYEDFKKAKELGVG